MPSTNGPADDFEDDDLDADALISAVHTAEERRNSSHSASKRVKLVAVDDDSRFQNQNASDFRAPDRDALLATLKRARGLNAFRPGQVETIEAVLDGRDACVFWSTGSGKSLCYQLPAFSTGKVSLVVSPLISLMQDQVTQLNNTSSTAGSSEGRDVAVFLGSAQMDPLAEKRVFDGEYLFVYVTPEKIAASGSFMNGIKRMADEKKLGLIAIDEAHCISAWGHDFRPDYQRLSVLRDAVPSVPIMALTATAVRHVREDIQKILKLRNPHVAQNSVDRTNLRIDVRRKTDFGRDLDFIVEQVSGAGAKKRPSSAVVYCPTIADVVKLTGALKHRLGDDLVGMYHGSLNPSERHDAHMAFLTSRCPIICATTAFGMGIDKPDVRFIFHYGAPKTMEEYYQQIGRAGRDGLTSSVSMMYGDGDFSRYSSDFYTQGLSKEALQAQTTSTNALKQYSIDRQTCRRVAIMKHFDENPRFLRCDQSCDNCKRMSGGAEARRNYTRECKPILLALRFCGSLPLTRLVDTIIGRSSNAAKVQTWQREQIDAARNEEGLQAGCSSADFYKEMVANLVNFNIVHERLVKGQYASYSVYGLTPDAQQFLSPNAPALMMTVPESVAHAERALKAKVAAVKKELVEGGVDVALIPEEELAVGHGEMMDAELEWMRKLKYYRESGRSARADALVDLLEKIEAWRDERASALGMAPAAVLSSHLCKRIAYSQPRSVEALRAVGVRVTGVEALSALINETVALADVEAPAPTSTDAISLGVVSPESKWPLAEYKPKKGPGGTMLKPNWEISYDRFMGSERAHCETIAMTTQPKAIQPATVFNHLLEALVHGKPLDYDRAIATLPPDHRLTRTDANAFVERAASRAQDVVRDRAFNQRALLDGVVRDVPFTVKSPEERLADAAAYTKLRTWVALRRAGVFPS